MGYMHIVNLYRPEAQGILKHEKVYALEKVHGTSAHVAWDGKGGIAFFSGGAKHPQFKSIFNEDNLKELFAATFADCPAVVYGEAYGGKMQGMSGTYGSSLRFIAFDVKAGAHWLPVPAAEAVALKCGFQFVPYVVVPATVEALDAERDRPSRVGAMLGFPDRPAEGIVIRPLVEAVEGPNNTRVMAKHKRAEFGETKTERKVDDPEKLKVWEGAQAVAEEWVTDMRLTHVLDKLGNPTELNRAGDVVRAMQEDVLREGKGEIANPEDAMKAIGKKAAGMFKARITKVVVN